MVIDQKGGKRLFSSQYTNGAYQQAQPLSFSDGTTADVDPEIAPDGSFLLFCSSGRVNGDPKDHLYIVLKNGGDWGSRNGDTIRRRRGQVRTTSRIWDPIIRRFISLSDRTLPVSFPRTHEQAAQDLKRLEMWDNSNSNVWFMSLAPWLNAK